MKDISQLSEQAQTFGVHPEVHEPEGFIFLRDLPDGVEEDEQFQQLVADCLENNLTALDALRTDL